MRSPNAEFRAGVKAQLPILLGIMPFGLIYGVLALDAGLSPFAAFSMSWVVFAGSAQFIAAGLFAAGAPIPVLVLTTFVVNLRHMLYSASMAPYLKHLPPRWKWGIAYLLTDEVYATIITRYRDPIDGPEAHHNRHWFALGAGLTLWSSWQGSTLVGVWLGALIPESLGLDFTLALMFIALVIPTLSDRPSVAAAVVAGGMGMALNGLPYNLGLIAAVLIGVVVGLLLEDHLPTRRGEEVHA